MLFFGKKDEKKGLPEMPPSNMNFPIFPKPIPSFQAKNPIIQKPVQSSQKSIQRAPPQQSPPEEDDDEMPSERHALPSFPDSSMSKGFSQAAIKDAIGNDEKYAESTFQPILPKFPIQVEEDEEEKEQPKEMPKLSSKKEENVFVRIDKFHNARKALSDTQSRLNEIDSLLSKIREIKMREEQELSAWEKEVTELKAKIQSVRENIFERI